VAAPRYPATAVIKRKKTQRMIHTSSDNECPENKHHAVQIYTTQDYKIYKYFSLYESQLNDNRTKIPLTGHNISLTDINEIWQKQHTDSQASQILVLCTVGKL